jgi:5'-nucleotidase
MLQIKTLAFAEKVYEILVKGGANPSMKKDFLYYFLNDNSVEDSYKKEWRFEGKLGFGGKYRPERNVVTCYGEDENPVREIIMGEMNLALSKLLEKQILMVDLDGVCADFDAAIIKACPDIADLDQDTRSTRIDEICEANFNIFAKLEPIKDAIESVNLLKDYYDVYFLSTPMWNVPHSFTDKRLWVEQHFGEWVKKRLILTHRKDLNIGAYLIDDRLKNGAAEFTGKHIHFATKDFPDWKAVLKYLIG